MKKLCKYLFVLLLAVFWTAAACAEETGAMGGVLYVV